jgi:hypothetical protein
MALCYVLCVCVFVSVCQGSGFVSVRGERINVGNWSCAFVRVWTDLVYVCLFVYVCGDAAL